MDISPPPPPNNHHISDTSAEEKSNYSSEPESKGENVSNFEKNLRDSGIGNKSSNSCVDGNDSRHNCIQKVDYDNSKSTGDINSENEIDNDKTGGSSDSTNNSEYKEILCNNIVVENDTNEIELAQNMSGLIRDKYSVKRTDKDTTADCNATEIDKDTVISNLNIDINWTSIESSELQAECKRLGIFNKRIEKKNALIQKLKKYHNNNCI